MTLTYADLFTGIGGAAIGARRAGLTPIWGIEKDSTIAHFGTANTGTVYCKDVTEVNWYQLFPPDWLHASPPCVNASGAKVGAQETVEDATLGYAIQKAIRILRPQYFSLENVGGYRDFTSFKRIVKCLADEGYYIQFNAPINAQFAGVPQSRRRLFLIASRRFGPLTASSIPRQGWFSAVEDLIPTLPKTTLTKWQQQAIAVAEIDIKKEPILIKRSGARKRNGIPGNTICTKDQPAFTIKAMSGNVRPSVKQATIVYEGQPYEADTRCLLRWQTLPDDIQLSGNLVLDTKMIGNAVPPQLMKHVIQSTLQSNYNPYALQTRSDTSNCYPCPRSLSQDQAVS